MDNQQPEPKFEAMKEKGWAIEYLLGGDKIFGTGRLEWWMDVIGAGELPDTPIPHIEFQHGASNRLREGLPVIPKTRGKKTGPPLTASGARKHLEDLVSRMGGGWDALSYLIEWLSWSLGVGCTEEFPEPRYEQKWHEYLYVNFELGRLQAADSDVFGGILSERHGAGWNPHAFYPTPHSICNMMVRMTVDPESKVLPDGRDARMMSVCDPCVGTGRMLLEASNYSVNLSGMDVDRMMVNACCINMALFAPWAVYMTPIGRSILDRPSISQGDLLVQNMNEARILEGHPPAISKGEEYTFNRHGQGDLFSVLNKEKNK